MTCLIRDKDHYFNLNHIATIREVRPNLFQALDENGEFIDEFSDFHNTILHILPIGKESWECLLPDLAGLETYYATPVIAWGLNPEGLLLPILANTREAISCEYDFGLRKTGNETVYASHGDTFENAEKWLAAVSR